MSTIYSITHRESGRVYVGFTSLEPAKRWKQHQANAKYHCDGYLYDTIRKHGPESFDFNILESHATNADGLKAERFLIEYLRSLGADLFNVAAGGLGGGGMIGRRHTPETKAKMSAALRNNKRGLGYRHSPEAVERIRQSKLGKAQSEDHKAAIRRGHAARKECV